MFLYGKIENLVAEAYNQNPVDTVKPGVQLTSTQIRITHVFAKVLILTAIGLIHAAVPIRLLVQAGTQADLRAVRIAHPAQARWHPGR